MLLTFGSGTHGCLGHGGYNDATKPKIVEALLGCTVVRISCGPSHVMALTGELLNVKFDVTLAKHRKQHHRECGVIHIFSLYIFIVVVSQNERQQGTCVECSIF